MGRKRRDLAGWRPYAAFARRLRSRAEGTKIPARKLAEVAGTSEASMSRLLHGTRQPTAAELLKLAYYLGTSPYWLWYGWEPKT